MIKFYIDFLSGTGLSQNSIANSTNDLEISTHPLTHTRYIPKFRKVSVKMHTVLIEDIQLCINSNDFNLEGIYENGI